MGPSLKMFTLHGPWLALLAHTIRLSTSSRSKFICCKQLALATMSTVASVRLSTEVASMPLLPQPYIERGEVLIVVTFCLPETRPWWSTKLSPSLGRLAGLYTERSTRSAGNQCWFYVRGYFLPSCSRAMSWIVWLNSSWGMTLLTLIVLLVTNVLIKVWQQVATCLAPSYSSCCGPQAWWRRCWQASPSKRIQQTCKALKTHIGGENWDC